MITMQRTDFPKIKKAPVPSIIERPAGNDAPLNAPPVKSLPANHRWAVPVAVLSAIILTAQVVLFIATWKMYKNIHNQQRESTFRSTEPSGADVTPINSAALPEAIRETVASGSEVVKDRQTIKTIINDFRATETKEAEKPNPQMIADFNRSDFVTNFNTRIYASRSGGASSLLSLEFDTNRRFGSYGNALAVVYDFTAVSEEAATLIIDLPLIDISGFDKLAFKLLADFKHNKGVMSPMRVQLISHSGEMIERDITDFFTFWKKYDVELWKNQDSPPREFLLKQIRMTVARSAGALKGGWHIDDIVLE